MSHHGSAEGIQQCGEASRRVGTGDSIVNGLGPSDSGYLSVSFIALLNNKSTSMLCITSIQFKN